MRAGIQAVIFDLDGTLLDRRRSFESFVRHQWQRFAHGLRSADQEHYVRMLIELDGDGYAPRHSLFTGVVTRFGLAPALAATLLDDYRAAFPRACMLFPDAIDTPAHLRRAGVKIGLITNGSVRMQQRKLDCLGLSPLFDTILISDAEGVSKPDREIFQRASARLHTNATEAVFVGDHPELDIAGARAAGMQAIWRRDPARLQAVEADAIVDELSDLLAWLGLEYRP